MFSHPSRDLSAFCQGELDAVRAARVAAHLESCGRCRADLSEVQTGIAIAQQAARLSAPEGMWPAIVAALNTAPAAAAPPARREAVRRRRILAIPAAVVSLAAIVGAAALWAALRPAKAWSVAPLDGSIRVGGQPIATRAVLPVDGRLETDGASRATIAVGRIGQVEVAPNSKVRLASSGWLDHRLSLERGSIRATIFAPPRVFFVDTPSATAVDLGCIFSLSVDDTGETTLRVASGWVALEAPARQVFVPAGATCRTRRAAGPGMPYFEDAPADLVRALDAIDGATSPMPAEVRRVLAAARPRDTLTLWHLLFRVDDASRGAVYDRLARLSPPPPRVTRDAVMALEGEALDEWRRGFEPPWNVESMWKSEWRTVWNALLGNKP